MHINIFYFAVYVNISLLCISTSIWQYSICIVLVSYLIRLLLVVRIHGGGRHDTTMTHSGCRRHLGRRRHRIGRITRIEEFAIDDVAFAILRLETARTWDCEIAPLMTVFTAWLLLVQDAVQVANRLLMRRHCVTMYI